MKKVKFLVEALLLVSSFSLASCGFLLDDTSSSGNDTKETTKDDDKTSTGTKTDDSTTTTTPTTKKEDKYEVLSAQYTFWTDSINSRWIKFAVPVKNTGNTDLYLGSMSIDIESSAGKLLKTKSYVSGYPEYIKPGETGYYFDETTVDFTDETVNLVPHTDVQHASNSAIRYDISDISIEADDLYGVKVLGRVENKTSSKGTLVKIAANLFDSNDKLICTCYTYLENDLAVGDKVGFTAKPFSYRSFTPSDVARYEVYSYPTQFNLNW